MQSAPWSGPSGLVMDPVATVAEVKVCNVQDTAEAKVQCVVHKATLERALRVQQGVVSAVMWQEPHRLKPVLRQLELLKLDGALASETGLSLLLADRTIWPQSVWY